jgi:hypothetical protein
MPGDGACSYSDGMIRRLAVAAVLPLVLLAGCSSDSGASAPAPAASATDEAIVGGVETVAPGEAEDGDGALEDGTLTADELAAVVDGAGDGYQCEPTSSGYTCSSGDAAAITIVGTADELGSVRAEGAVPAETLAAVAEALGVEVDDLAAAGDGLVWQQG